jgi:hypothetical protein
MPLVCTLNFLGTVYALKRFSFSSLAHMRPMREYTSTQSTESFSKFAKADWSPELVWGSHFIGAVPI